MERLIVRIDLTAIFRNAPDKRALALIHGRPLFAKPSRYDLSITHIF